MLGIKLCNTVVFIVSLRRSPSLTLERERNRGNRRFHHLLLDYHGAHSLFSTLSLFCELHTAPPPSQHLCAPNAPNSAAGARSPVVQVYARSLR
jgi:hypothetical protein